MARARAHHPTLGSPCKESTSKAKGVLSILQHTHLAAAHNVHVCTMGASSCQIYRSRTHITTGDNTHPPTLPISRHPLELFYRRAHSCGRARDVHTSSPSNTSLLALGRVRAGEGAMSSLAFDALSSMSPRGQCLLISVDSETLPSGSPLRERRGGGMLRESGLGWEEAHAHCR